MQRINLDKAQTAVKQFVRGLPLDEGVALELDGKIVCELFPPHAVSAAERAVLISRGRELAQRARTRNRGVPARVIEREVQAAIDEVRGRTHR